MSFERSGEAEANFDVVLTQKLRSFPVAKTLWLYLFSEQARQLYHDTLWDFVGDRKADDGAADPEIWSGEFAHLKHAFQTDDAKLIVMRQVAPHEPRTTEFRDFMTREVDLETGLVRRLFVIAAQTTSEVFFGAKRTREQYTFSEDPGHVYVHSTTGLDETFPSLQVDTPSRGPMASPGSFSPDGIERNDLTGNIELLVERARQFSNYYKTHEVEQLAGLFEETLPVPNAPQPVTIAA